MNCTWRLVVSEVIVVLLTVLSVAVACVALPYVEREEESELSQVSQSLVTSKGDPIIVLLKEYFGVTFVAYYLWESCL
jgi:hypothetical protein